ncbi:hypothetical protein MKEN_00015400 [Mycena kentingensis (nom. inval.)]|nr:hypothetical protein MKEN_00015400 [Mycena kentingensis (nom. inval.)]
MAATDTPRLPPELELHIFSIVAVSDLKTAPNLMLVCRRVRDWMQPILYRTVLLTGTLRPSIPGIPWCTPTAFKSAAPTCASKVKNLMLATVQSTFAEEALSVSPSVESLFVAPLVTAPSAALLALPALRRLSCDLGHIIDLQPKLVLRQHPAFQNLTHLELFRLPAAWGTNTDSDFTSNSWAQLARLPALTHLALTRAKMPASELPICAFLLSPTGCVRLTTFVLVGMADAAVLAHAASDVRFVVMSQLKLMDFFMDWIDGARFGEDFWARADAFIARRRSGEVEKSAYKVKQRGSPFVAERLVD